METIILTFDKPSKIKGNIFESIINLEAEEKLLIEKTNLINEATHKKHSEILSELISDLNIKLKVINLEFKRRLNMYSLTFENQQLKYPLSIRIDAISTRNVSKYTTYLGEYNIQITYERIIIGKIDYFWHNCNDIDKLEDRILNVIKQNKGLR